MLTNIFPPEKSLKNILLNILLTHQDLTVGEIKIILKKDYQKSITYQGIIKVLNMLNYENIINKNNKFWEINQEWIKTIFLTLSQFNETIKQNNFNEHVKTLKFPNVGNAWEFFINQLKNGKFNLSKDKSVLVHVKNFGYFGRDKKELSFVKKFVNENKCIFLVEKKNLVNRYIAKCLRSIGVNVLLGVPHSTPHSTIVLGDTTIFMYYTKEDLVDYHSKTHNKLKSLTSTAAINMFMTMRDDNRFEITVVFNHDKEVADLTRKHILKFARKYTH